jgi:uncharacterized lipoprotein
MAAVGLALCLAGVLLLSGCAFSPQSIKLAPVLPMMEPGLGQGRSFQVMVRDLRPHSALGSRGGIYADSSQIQPANRLDLATQRALHQGLVGLGFLPYSPTSVPVYASGDDPSESDENAVAFELVDTPANKADVAVHVDWIDLQYGGSNPLFPSKVEMSAVLNVHVETEFGSFQNQYQRANKKRFLMVPDQQQNQDAVNELLAQLLQQVLTDPRLTAVLAP